MEIIVNPSEDVGLAALESDTLEPIDISDDESPIDISNNDFSGLFDEPDEDPEVRTTSEDEVNSTTTEDDDYSDFTEAQRLKVDRRLAKEKQALEEQYEDRLLATENQQRYGWDSSQTEDFIQYQQQQRNEMFSEVTHAVNELATDPKFPGIKAIEPAIQKLLWDNPSLSIEQAYRVAAPDSPVLVEQLKREAQQREISRRSGAKRTVSSDVSSNQVDLSPQISASDLNIAKSMGITQQDAKRLLSMPEKMNLQEYRKWKQKGS